MSLTNVYTKVTTIKMTDNTFNHPRKFLHDSNQLPNPQTKEITNLLSVPID